MVLIVEIWFLSAFAYNFLVLACAVGMISISSIFTCGGRVTTKRMASAISSAYRGCKSFVYLVGFFLISFKANQAEFGINGTRINGSYLNPVIHQVDAHGLG